MEKCLVYKFLQSLSNTTCKCFINYVKKGGMETYITSVNCKCSFLSNEVSVCTLTQTTLESELSSWKLHESVNTKKMAAYTLIFS